MLMGWQHLRPNDLTVIQRGIAEGRALGGPWHIELQPTNLCNVDCFFCISRSGRAGESMPWPMLERLLREGRARDLRLLRLTGGGEPIIYPRFEGLLDLCGELGIRLENINTNAVTLARSAETIARVGLDWILISLNETTPDLYAKSMRTRPAVFDHALDGARAMAAARDALPPAERPRIWIQFFLWKDSIPQIRCMYELGRELGADTIFIRSIIGDFWNHEKMTEADRPEIESALRDIIAEDHRRGEYKLHFEVSQELDLHHFTHREQRRGNPPPSENIPDITFAAPRTEYCYVGWYTTSISAKGEVFPCFQYHDMRTKRVGSLHDAPLQDIWNGAPYQAFRNQIHELIRLRGNMEPSDKYNRYIEHKCADCEKCQYNFRLADPEFYESATRGAEAGFGLLDRSRARIRNTAIQGAHRLLRRPR